MPKRLAHSWKLDYQQAIALQRRFAPRVRMRTPAGLRRRLADPELLVAGADVSYTRYASSLFAAVVLVRLGDLAVVERVGHRAKATFPYVPGLLSFREVPAVIEAFRGLSQQPDLLVCDGQGLAHPRRFGLACHLGLLLDIPTIGCAKSRLVGTFREPGRKRGAHTALTDGSQEIGRVVRTRTGVKPVFVSVGHKIDLENAVKLILRCTSRFRIPEPTRQAHLTVNRIRECLTLK